MRRNMILLAVLIIIPLFLTGCGKKELRIVELGETFRIANKETVSIDGHDFKITRLGNASCKRGEETCVFDGLKVLYTLTIDDVIYNNDNIEKTPYRVNVGETDYKNYAKITITKLEEIEETEEVSE